MAFWYDFRNAQGSANKFFFSLDVVEDRRSIEGQFHLVAIEHLHHQHFMSQKPQSIQAVVEGVQVREQVRDDH